MTDSAVHFVSFIFFLEINGQNNTNHYLSSIKVFVNTSENLIHLKFGDLVIDTSIKNNTNEIVGNFSTETQNFPQNSSTASFEAITTDSIFMQTNTVSQTETDTPQESTTQDFISGWDTTFTSIDTNTAFFKYRNDNNTRIND